MEVWKDIKGYEGAYQVSNIGRVKSIDRIGVHSTGAPCRLKGKILSPGISDGYAFVMLSRKKFKVHRLVAAAFIPNPYNKPCINHIDCNRLNNNVQNLEWATISENNKHAFLQNRNTPPLQLGRKRSELTKQKMRASKKTIL